MSKSNVLALTFLDLHPERAASILEQMDLKTVATFFQGIPFTIAGPVASFMLPQYVAKIITMMHEDASAALLSEMTHRRVAGTLRYTEKSLRKRLIARLPTQMVSLLGLFLNYTEDMVGAWMVADIMTLPDDCTVQEALDRLSNTDQKTHGGMVYIINREAQLQGALHVSTLLRQNPNMPVSVLFEEEVSLLAARSTLTSVADHPGWKKRNALPVVNREKKLVGVLRHTDLHQGLQHIASDMSEVPVTDAAGGLWDVYGSTLLSLFDTIGTMAKGQKSIRGQE